MKESAHNVQNDPSDKVNFIFNGLGAYIQIKTAQGKEFKYKVNTLPDHNLIFNHMYKGILFYSKNYSYCDSLGTLPALNYNFLLKIDHLRLFTGVFKIETKKYLVKFNFTDSNLRFNMIKMGSNWFGDSSTALEDVGIRD